MTKVIVAKTKYDCEHLIGSFVDESNYDILVEEDTDCYLPGECSAMERAECKEDNCANCPNRNTQDENKIAFKFRKNFFSKEEQQQAYLGLREAATQSQNRGKAAGPKGAKLGGRDWVTEFQIQAIQAIIDEEENVIIATDLKKEIQRLREILTDDSSTRGIVWLSAEVKRDNFVFEKWLKKVLDIKSIKERKQQAKEIKEKYISDTNYANSVYSGIAGWFDRYPRIPYGRATSYTQNQFDKFKMAFPFLQSLNRGFQELLPKRWKAQKAAVDRIDPKFIVPGTVFSTITVNKTFRTACHRDAGDFSDGLSNLLVLSNNGNYSGGYLVFPEVRVAVNVRPGDLLLVNNHEIIHGNTPIVLNDPEAERISLVCYLREKMLDLGSYEYENLRYEFVESRRKNKEHPDWVERWNGISPGMWDSEEWYNYLDSHKQKDLRKGSNDTSRRKASPLEEFF